MGRIVQGNAVSVQATKLTTTLGVLFTSPVVADNGNISSINSSPWGSFQTVTTTTSASRPNTASEQVNNSFTIQQDPIKPYNLVQANISGAGLRQIILDDELNMVGNYSPSMSGASMIAVRLYDGVMYRFGYSGSTLRVETVNLVTGVVTPYTTTLSFSASNMRVFNWQIGGKFHMVLTAATAASFISFDLTTGALVVIKSWSGTGLSTLYAMHVSPDGSACSVSAYNSTSTDYSVLCFPASGSATFTGASGVGHVSYNGQWNVFGNTVGGSTLAITEACAIEVSSTVGNTSSSTYLMGVFHMAAGDNAVRVTQFTGTVTNVHAVTLSATCASRPNNTLVFGAMNGSNTVIQVGRSGTNLTLIAFMNSASFTNQHLTVPCALPGLHVSMSSAGGEGNAYLSFVAALSNTGRSASWSFVGSVGSRNANPYATATDSCRMAFVTRTARVFYLGWYWSQGNTTATYNTARLPVFVAPKTAIYDAQVIGAGGNWTSGVCAGGSSSFAGITAAPGGIRSGGRAGSTVITSGPSAGTGGLGYAEDRFGQGEDTGGAGAYGGGAGYVATGRVSVQAGEAIPYVAGLAPQYGGQGAVLLTEVL